MLHRSALLMDGLTETYLDTSRIIDQTVKRFVRLFGGNYHDLRAEADLFYIQAYDSHTSRLSSFPTWLRIKVWRGLQEYMRTHIARDNRCPRVWRDFNVEPAKDLEPFDLSDFLDSRPDLSPDARELITLVIQPPLPVRVNTSERGEETPWHITLGVREYLRDCGWNKSRMDKAFAEVRGVL